MVDIIFALGCATLVFVVVLFHWRERHLANPRNLPLPPGPKPEPIIGNARHIPEESWLKFTEWRDIYGDIVHLNILGTRIVVLSSYEACADLFKKAIYSDRPRFYVMDRLMKLGQATSLAPYGPALRQHRRLLRSALHQKAVEQYQPMQIDRVNWYLSTLILEPDNFLTNLHLLMGRVVVKATYGVDVQSVGDTYIAWARTVIDGTTVSMGPSNAVYNILPLLMHIPSAHAARLKKVSGEVRKIVDKLLNVPFNAVKAKMDAGTVPPSIVATALKSGRYAEEDVKWATGNLYLAGADTTYGIVTAVLFTMVKHPEVQRKAQAEIDRVVGERRLPTFADRPALPYIDCIIKETLRWSPLLPGGVPRNLLEDDYYEGYWIPKGTMVIPNIWAISRNGTLYEDAERFWPERFEGGKGLDPRLWAFGFGRRICPGLHFADAMAFIILASVLATFDLSKPIDNYGKEVEPEETYACGLIRSLDPFKCTIKPRSASAAALAESHLA
ncbi:hypothetical protein BOTBODRAFT_360742 [Botryobasidium botryosum FD-172 SS1]|uniref:Cytochrome P450 n=1 Tax=Botryobasidium botryosum (strain FD-172 SS1) TaxID=930990 RepID=A0A067MDG9_BOTB1|nr:hypothetical protein BOTBODRAFT_360742 [Botryobasidium botryosum FD-172 SS1]